MASRLVSRYFNNHNVLNISRLWLKSYGNWTNMVQKVFFKCLEICLQLLTARNNEKQLRACVRVLDCADVYKFDLNRYNIAYPETNISSLICNEKGCSTNSCLDPEEIDCASLNHLCITPPSLEAWGVLIFRISKSSANRYRRQIFDKLFLKTCCFYMSIAVLFKCFSDMCFHIVKVGYF